MGTVHGQKGEKMAMANITIPIQVNLPEDWLEQVIERLRNDPEAEWVEITRCKDCKHYYYADNRIPQEQRYVCDLDSDRWNPDDYCSYAERR